MAGVICPWNPNRQTRSGGDPSSSGDDSDENARRVPARRQKESSRRDDSRRRHRGHDGSSGSDRSRFDSAGTKRTKPSRWLKPEKFDGPGCFETFVVIFENCAMYNG